MKKFQITFATDTHQSVEVLADHEEAAKAAFLQGQEDSSRTLIQEDNFEILEVKEIP